MALDVNLNKNSLSALFIKTIFNMCKNTQRPTHKLLESEGWKKSTKIFLCME
jgi:hypothetical protein